MIGLVSVVTFARGTSTDAEDKIGWRLRNEETRPRKEARMLRGSSVDWRQLRSGTITLLLCLALLLPSLALADVTAAISVNRSSERNR